MTMNFSAKRLVMLVAVFAVALMAGQTAYSQLVDLDKLSKLPRTNTMTEEKFEEESVLFAEVPKGDRSLEYSVRLPKGWQKGGSGAILVPETAVQKKTEPSSKYDISHLRDTKIEEEKKRQKDDNEKAMKAAEEAVNKDADEEADSNFLGPVAKYAGPASNLDSFSSFDILSMQMTQDLTVKNWFLNYLLTKKYTILGLEVINPQRVEALFVYLDKGTTFYVRAAAIANGTRMILVSYQVPEAYWEKEKELQQKSLDSFRFLHAQPSSFGVKKTFGFMDVSKFVYPATWKLVAPNVFSMDAMRAKLMYSADAVSLDGEIDINLISTELDTTLIKEVEAVRNGLENRNIKIGDLLETKAGYEFDSSITFSRVEVYKIKKEGHTALGYEYWLAVMVENRYYYIVTMITPDREHDFYKWSHNSETFGEVIQSLMPQQEGEVIEGSFRSSLKKADDLSIDDELRELDEYKGEPTKKGKN